MCWITPSLGWVSCLWTQVAFASLLPTLLFVDSKEWDGLELSGQLPVMAATFLAWMTRRERTPTASSSGFPAVTGQLPGIRLPVPSSFSLLSPFLQSGRQLHSSLQSGSFKSSPSESHKVLTSVLAVGQALRLWPPLCLCSPHSDTFCLSKSVCMHPSCGHFHISGKMCGKNSCPSHHFRHL